MKNFHRDSRPGGNRNFKKRGFGGGRDSGRPLMHQAICAECDKACQVPFKPTGDRAVFCRDCFERRGSPGQGGPRDNHQRRTSFEDKRMFAAVCSKCGNRCEVPFRPVDGKPVFCKQCFDQGGKAGAGKGADQFTGQWEILNAKLDRILIALTPAAAETVPEEKMVTGVKEPNGKIAAANTKAGGKKAGIKKKK
ncbi:MAG: hypothetical protein HYV42_03820 [Candidatus Magasanikbacteria bacterium]|nr:hypothetical protein [Candidatus Magasanikbacteria bacterium]